MSSDKLFEIPVSSLPELRELFKPNWPVDVVAYNTVDNYINWLREDPHLANIKIYCLNNDWTDGTYIIVDRYQVFLYTLEESCDRLTRALLLLDWTDGLLLCSFMKKHLDAANRVIDNLKLKYYFFNHNVMFFQSREEAKLMELVIPEGITLRKLSTENAHQINEAWPFRHNGSLYYIQRLIRLSENIGAYDQEDKLVAWCFRLQSGGLGTLQVAENSFRKGLGTLVTKYLLKKFSDKNWDTYAYVLDDNVPSRKLFEKCNFKIVDEVFWLFTKPMNPDVSFDWTRD